MTEISSELYARILGVLQKCDEFGSDVTLRDLFAHPDLRAFAGGLPQRDTSKARVQAVLAYLQGQRTKAGVPALGELLMVLSRLYEDARRAELVELAELVQRNLDPVLDPSALNDSAHPAALWWRANSMRGGVVVTLLALASLGLIALWQLSALIARRGGTSTPATVPAVSATATETRTDTLEPTATATDTAISMPTRLAGATMIGPVDSAVYVYVPAGTYPMGASASDSDASGNENPQHTVSLDAYWIGRTEVTNAQYAQCVAADQCEPWDFASDSAFNAPNQPVVGVSWYDAQAYALWAGGFLPTEAQWEVAARGTDGRVYPWGNTFDGRLLNFCDKSCSYDWHDLTVSDGVGDTTARVGRYLGGASPYGALDMAGNVWEWVADWYDAGYYVRSPQANPTGPETGEYKILRGGSWRVDLTLARASDRDRGHPQSRNYNVGFRVVRR